MIVLHSQQLDNPQLDSPRLTQTIRLGGDQQQGISMPGKFSKTLAKREVITLAFGAMIGWSWVLLTGEWLLRAGSLGTVIAFSVGGTAVIFISLTYAELASAMPRAGGEHVYTYRARGYTPSFIASWAIVMA